MPKQYIVPVKIEELGDAPGFLAVCPVIQGCHAEGATIPEALQNLEDVARIILEARVEYGLGLPEGLREAKPGSIRVRGQIVVPFG